MTSISAASAGSYLSPLDLLKQELQSEVASGTISSSDQDALSSALDDIDSALTSQRQADSTGGKPPGDMQSKIDDLIAGEVSSGKLTSDQATELKNVFANAFANGGPGGPPPSDASSTETSSSTDSTDSSSSSSSSSSAEEMLKKLLEALQQSLSQSTSYSASGGSTSSSPTSLLVDFKS